MKRSIGIVSRLWMILFAASALASSVASAAAAAPPTERLEIHSLNGVYNDLGSELRPVQRGTLELRVGSPEHRLTVHGNTLTLADEDGDGVVDMELEIDFEGEGLLTIELVATGTRFEDRVAAPRQTVRMAGRARLARVDGGFDLTVVEAPASVGLRIESGLADKLVGVCKSFAALFAADCDGFAKALAVANVPMPQPGESFFLDDTRLTQQERKALERFASPPPLPAPRATGYHPGP